MEKIMIHTSNHPDISHASGNYRIVLVLLNNIFVHAGLRVTHAGAKLYPEFLSPILYIKVLELIQIYIKVISEIGFSRSLFVVYSMFIRYKFANLRIYIELISN